MKTTLDFDALARKGETFVLAMTETLPIRGNVMASGDDAHDRAVEDRTLAELESGNVWAWCSVQVSVVLDGFTGEAYLGGCSYDSEESFRKDAYFEDMVREARDDLARKLELAHDTLTKN